MATGTPLHRAIERAGSLKALAEALAVERQVVFNWHERQVPAKYCPLIERETGVRCEELRPDIEWGVLRQSK